MLPTFRDCNMIFGCLKQLFTSRKASDFGKNVFRELAALT